LVGFLCQKYLFDLLGTYGVCNEIHFFCFLVD
jgi:hypothetical protein